MLKKIKLFFICIISIFVSLTTTSCVAKAFEDEINVVFMYEDEFISHDTVTQFKNIKTPSLDAAYIPDGYKFFGWTPYDPNTVFATDENFKDKYIGVGDMVHWADIEEHKDNSTVVLKALMIDKNDIPKVYHYVVVAWYAKEANSGLNEVLIGKFEDALFGYLTSIDVSQTDLDSIVIRSYNGNVGPTCGQILEDDDVDIMLGWGSKDNIMGTGGMPASMIYETVSEYIIGTHKRYLHRISEKETALVVFEWMQSEACRNLFL